MTTSSDHVDQLLPSMASLIWETVMEQYRANPEGAWMEEACGAVMQALEKHDKKTGHGFSKGFGYAPNVAMMERAWMDLATCGQRFLDEPRDDEARAFLMWSNYARWTRVDPQDRRSKKQELSYLTCFLIGSFDMMEQAISCFLHQKNEPIEVFESFEEYYGVPEHRQHIEALFEAFNGRAGEFQFREGRSLDRALFGRDLAVNIENMKSLAQKGYKQHGFLLTEEKIKELLSYSDLFLHQRFDLGHTIAKNMPKARIESALNSLMQSYDVAQEHNFAFIRRGLVMSYRELLGAWIFQQAEKTSLDHHPQRDWLMERIDWLARVSCEQLEPLESDDNTSKNKPVRDLNSIIYEIRYDIGFDHTEPVIKGHVLQWMKHIVDHFSLQGFTPTAEAVVSLFFTAGEAKVDHKARAWMVDYVANLPKEKQIEVGEDEQNMMEWLDHCNPHDELTRSMVDLIVKDKAELMTICWNSHLITPFPFHSGLV